MNERRWLALALTLYACLAVGYGVLMPMWEAPDEQAYYRLALYVARNGSLPPRRFNHEAFQPPLYGWLASWPLRALAAADPELVEYHIPKRRGRPGPRPTFKWTAENYRFQPGAQLLRLLNVCVGGVTLLVLYAGARRFAREPPELARATVALVGLTPQFLHISASVNSDPLANLAGAVLFRLMAELRGDRQPLGRLAWMLVAALALPVLIKLTVLPMGAALLLAVTVHVGTHWRTHWLRCALGAVLLVSCLAATYALLLPGPADNLLWTLRQRGVALRPAFLADLAPWFLAFVWSYWGLVGMLIVGVPRWVMLSASAFAGVGLMSALRLLLPRGAFLLRRASSVVPGTRRGWALVWAAAALAVLAVARNYLATPATQGRYLYPALGPLSLLMVAGWLLLLPRRLHPMLPGAILVAWTAVNVHLWTVGIVPFYFQPFLD